jgi:hypothetical protein
MITRTMHMSGHATGAARLGATCSALAVYPATPAPILVKWLAPNVEQVSPVFGTDRPTRRLLERFP